MLEDVIRGALRDLPDPPDDEGEEKYQQPAEEKKDVDIIRDKFNFLLSNFNNSFNYRRPRSASDVVSERSRRSNAPSSSIPLGYSAEPGSTESLSQSGSVVSELAVSYTHLTLPTKRIV